MGAIKGDTRILGSSPNLIPIVIVISRFFSTSSFPTNQQCPPGTESRGKFSASTKSWALRASFKAGFRV